MVTITTYSTIIIVIVENVTGVVNTVVLIPLVNIQL